MWARNGMYVRVLTPFTEDCKGRAGKGGYSIRWMYFVCGSFMRYFRNPYVPYIGMIGGGSVGIFHPGYAWQTAF